MIVRVLLLNNEDFPNGYFESQSFELVRTTNNNQHYREKVIENMRDFADIMAVFGDIKVHFDYNEDVLYVKILGEDNNG